MSCIAYQKRIHEARFSRQGLEAFYFEEDEDVNVECCTAPCHQLTRMIWLRCQLLFCQRFLDRIFPNIKKQLHTFFFCFELYTARFSVMQYTSAFHELSVGFLVWGFSVVRGLGKKLLNFFRSVSSFLYLVIFEVFSSPVIFASHSFFILKNRIYWKTLLANIFNYNFKKVLSNSK